LKYSPLFSLYLTFFKPSVIKEAKREKAFYRSFLPACKLVFDIGANDGHKTEAFLSFAKKVVSCEPDTKNFQLLTIRFRNRKKRVFLENVALGPAIGETTMYLHHEGSAFNTLNPKFKEITESDNLNKWSEKIAFTDSRQVTVLTLDALVEKYGRPEFIKIDVEGYELEVIKGLSQPIAWISLECLFPEFREELQESLRLLRRLDLNLKFSIAVNEKLIWKEFQSFAFLQNFLDYFTEHHFELVVHMPSATPAP
jgi:FkbM family methyltransferase